jgi:hypothetical protein
MQLELIFSFRHKPHCEREVEELTTMTVYSYYCPCRCDYKQRQQDIKDCLAKSRVFTSNKYFGIKLIIMTGLSKFFTSSVIMALLGMTPLFCYSWDPLLKFIPTSWGLYQAWHCPQWWYLQRDMSPQSCPLVSILLAKSSDHWHNALSAINFASSTHGSTVVVPTFTKTT